MFNKKNTGLFSLLLLVIGVKTANAFEVDYQVDKGLLKGYEAQALQDAYNTLGIESNASNEDVEKAFKAKTSLIAITAKTKQNNAFIKEAYNKIMNSRKIVEPAKTAKTVEPAKTAKPLTDEEKQREHLQNALNHFRQAQATMPGKGTRKQS